MDRSEFLKTLTQVEDIHRDDPGAALALLESISEAEMDDGERKAVRFYTARALFAAGRFDDAARNALDCVRAVRSSESSRPHAAASSIPVLRFAAEAGLRAQTPKLSCTVLSEVQRQCRESGMAEQAEGRIFMGHVGLNLGVCFRSTGDMQAARSVLRDSMDLLEDEEGAATLWGAAVATLATIEDEVGNVSVSTELYLRALPKLEEIENPAQAQILAGLVKLEQAGHVEISDAESGERASFQELLAEESQGHGDLSVRAVERVLEYKRLFAERNISGARRCIDEAIALIGTSGSERVNASSYVAVVDAAFGFYGSVGELDKCRSLAETSLEWCKGNADGRQYMWRFHQLLGMVAHLNNQPELAVQSYEDSWAAISSTVAPSDLSPKELWSYLEQRVEVLQLLAEGLLDLGDAVGCWHALEVLSRLRLTAPAETPANSHLETTDEGGPDDTAAAFDLLLRSAVAMLDRDSRGRRRFAEHQDANLLNYLSDSVLQRLGHMRAVAVNRLDLPDLKRPLPSIDAGAAVVNLLSTRNACGAVILTDNETATSIEFSISSSELQVLLAELHDDVRRAGFLTDEYLQQLYTDIWMPIERVLLTQGELPKSIVIVPRGLFHHVPFHALCDSEGDGRWPVATRFALEYSPSGNGSEAVTWPNESTRLTLLIVASEDVPRAEDEIEVLRQFPFEVVICRNATVAELEKQLDAYTPDIVHIINHGYVEYGVPELSRVAMGGAEAITVADLMTRLRLNGTLVFLSACDTGQSRYHRADFGNSLVSACFDAGAVAVVATLWPVLGSSAVKFTEAFYRTIAGGNPLVAAYSNGLMATIEQSAGFEAPYHLVYWGPFMLWRNRGISQEAKSR